MFFTQKISESLNINKSACGVFFDISKAFDKVWHDGLVFKLSKLGIPTYILKYIIDFLSNRSFRVKVSNSYSNFYPIKCSVPQGSVLGPLLFLVYINDIPLTNIMNNKFCKSNSSLFISFYIICFLLCMGIGQAIGGVWFDKTQQKVISLCTFLSVDFLSC